jgi:hypothetical protein
LFTFVNVPAASIDKRILMDPSAPPEHLEVNIASAERLMAALENDIAETELLMAELEAEIAEQMTRPAAEGRSWPPRWTRTIARPRSG